MLCLGLFFFFVRLAASVIVMRNEHGYVRGFNTLMKILDGALPFSNIHSIITQLPVDCIP